MESRAEEWMAQLFRREAECVSTLDREAMHYESVEPEMKTTRQFCLGAAVAGALLSIGGPARASSADALNEVLEASLKEKKGVVLYVRGQAVAGRVTRLSGDAVELSSRDYVRIVVRRNRIDGIGTN
jgi:hypothetical protein